MSSLSSEEEGEGEGGRGHQAAWFQVSFLVPRHDQDPRPEMVPSTAHRSEQPVEGAHTISGVSSL